ncbi:MAG: hypothetical protein GY800_11015 [Planctomycetes bacterium]|nr:hypothetical protein [Planctomycetota bacterium]
MTYFEPETEREIIERLDRMKAKIDAFVASLEEETQKLIREKVYIGAPMAGEVDGWYFGNGKEGISKGIPVCRIINRMTGIYRDALSPAAGKLYIIKWPKEDVSRGTPIGYIELPDVPV